MPFINGRFYANLAYGRALELARIAEEFGQDALHGGTNPAQETGKKIIEGVPSLDINSLLQTAREQDSNHPSGFCTLRADFTPHGVKCEEGKDYHGEAVISLSGIGFSSHYVEPHTIRVRAEAEGDIVSVDSHPTEYFGDPKRWAVRFTIKSGPGFRQQGGNILWTVTYKCLRDDVVMRFPQTLHCL